MRIISREGKMYSMGSGARYFGLSGNQLKLIALTAMTVDHVGMMLFPFDAWFRMVGRLAFPIFAYMIGEGCAYTRSLGRYLGKMAGLALVCQIVYYLFMDSLYQSVLVTFSLSILLIFTLDNALKRSSLVNWAAVLITLAAIVFLTEFLPGLLPGTDYGVDYGFGGVVLPAVVFLGETRKQKLGFFAAGTAVLGIVYGGIQWFGLLAVPLMMLYNGQRGKRKMKNLFYIYYPAHLVVIYAIGLIV